VQTGRDRQHFLPINPVTKRLAERPAPRMTAIAAAMMLVSLVAVVLLAKAFSPFIQGGVVAIGAPAALVGVVVAAIVLMPEAATALRAAREDRLQTSINLALGSAVATIGLTIPTVSLVAWWTGTQLELGVSAGGAMLLGLSFIMAMITYGSGRATLLSGIVHLILLAVWLFLIVSP